MRGLGHRAQRPALVERDRERHLRKREDRVEVDARDLGGLAACYAAALPFLQNTIVGDLFWTSLLFGGYAAVRLVLLDNPIGQSDEQTPIVVIRPLRPQP